MEKQIIQTLAFVKEKKINTPLVMKPLQEKDLLQYSVSVKKSLQDLVNARRVNDLELTITGYSEIIYQTLVAVHGSKMADRIILAIDVLHNATMFDKKPNMKKVIEKDFHSFDDHKETLDHINSEQNKNFDKQISDKINELLSGEDKVKYSEMLELENHLKSFIKVNILTDEQANGRVAKITVGNQMVTVKEVFA